MSPSGYSCDDNTFDGLNVEWCKSAIIIDLHGVSGTFLGCHLEGNIITGSEPSVWRIIDSDVQISGGKTLNTVINTANCSGSGTTAPGIFTFFDSGRLNIKGHRVSATAGIATATNIAFNLFKMLSFSTAPIMLTGDAAVDMHCDGYEGWASLDATMPRATYGDFNDVAGYNFPKVFPAIKASVIRNPATGFVLAGSAGQEVTIIYDTPITGAVTLTLGLNMMLGSDKGNTLARPNRDQVLVVRKAGCTGAFSIVVHNATVGGTTIATLASASTSATLGLNSGAWAAI
jgi:hypothetical protein